MSVLIRTLWNIKQTAANLIGLGESLKETEFPVNPVPVIVQGAMAYANFTSGKIISPNEIDIACRHLLPNMTAHKSYAGTCAVATGAAAKIKGTIVNDLLPRLEKGRDVIRIGHPSGALPVEASVTMEGDAVRLEKAKIFMTARRIMEGCVYI